MSVRYLLCAVPPTLLLRPLMSRSRKAAALGVVYPTREVLIYLVGSLIASLMLVGCAIPIASENGTNTHLIIGVGIVKTADSANRDITVVKSKSLGVSLNNTANVAVSVGYQSSVVSSISAELDGVILEVTDDRNNGFSIHTETMNSPANESKPISKE